MGPQKRIAGMPKKLLTTAPIFGTRMGAVVYSGLSDFGNGFEVTTCLGPPFYELAGGIA